MGIIFVFRVEFLWGMHKIKKKLFDVRFPNIVLTLFLTWNKILIEERKEHCYE